METLKLLLLFSCLTFSGQFCFSVELELLDDEWQGTESPKPKPSSTPVPIAPSTETSTPKYITYPTEADNSKEITDAVGDQINLYLESNVGHNGIVSNILKAKQWLDEQQATNISSTLKLEQNQESELSRTIKSFVALAGINQENVCSSESFDRLYNIDRLLNGRARTSSIERGYNKGLGNRRLDLIMRHYCVEHARVCLNDLSNLHSQILHQKRIAMQFIDEIIVQFAQGVGLKSPFHQDESVEPQTKVPERLLVYKQLHKNIVLRADPLMELQGIEARAVKTIRRSANATLEPDLIYLNPFSSWTSAQQKDVRRGKVTNLVEKYLVKPCETFQMKLGEVFSRADFGTRFDRVFRGNESQYSFYYDWAAYRLCQTLTKDYKQLVESLLEVVVLDK